MIYQEYLNIDHIHLDTLNAAELNALPFGVIKLDADGVVTFYSAGETRISDRSAEHCIGRSFFEEFEPTANISQFHDRLRAVIDDGVERDSFEYFFTFYVPRLRAQIELRKAASSGQCWMILQPIEVLKDFRDVNAVRLVEAAVTCSATTRHPMSVCDREAIHIPEAIQPHGALIVLDPEILSIRAVSGNVAQYLGISPAGLLNLSADRIFPRTFLTDLSTALPLTNSSHSGMIRLGQKDGEFNFLAHRSGDGVLIEIEPSLDEAPRTEPFLVSKFLSLLSSRLGQAFGRDQVTQLLAHEVRALTEFDRVIVYRFDESGDGEVIAEDKAEDWDQSFMGLRFPASDIPIQARRLYHRSRFRHLPDNDYLSATLLRVDKAAPPIDLSLAWLRSISPVHREYHRNMGVAATFSASIMAAGELWGLIIGHHRVPKKLGFSIREGIGFASELIGPRLIQEQIIEQQDLRAEHEQAHRSFLEELPRAMSLREALISGPVGLPDLFLDSYGAVYRLGGETNHIGHTPEPAVVDRILSWILSVVRTFGATRGIK